MRRKNTTIQIMRALAIIAVVVHHALVQLPKGGAAAVAVDSIIICFHMPVFFIISGYLFENSTAKDDMTLLDFAKSKAKRLLVPYVFWTVFLWLVIQNAYLLAPGFMENIGFPPMSITDLIYGLFTFEKHYVEQLWFLYVLFLFFITHYIIGPVGRSRWFTIAGLVIGTLSVIVPLPDILRRYFIWAVFFSFGRLAAADKAIEKTVMSVKTGYIFVAAAFILLSAIRIMMGNAVPGMPKEPNMMLSQIIKYSIGFLGSWLIYAGSLAVSQGNVSKPIQVSLTHIGDMSYDIYLMHNPYVVALTMTVLCRSLHMPGDLALMIAVVLGICIPMFISKKIIREIDLLKLLMLGGG